MKQTFIALAVSAGVLLTSTAAFAQAKDTKGMQVFRAQNCRSAFHRGIGTRRGLENSEQVSRLIKGGHRPTGGAEDPPEGTAKNSNFGLTRACEP